MLSTEKAWTSTMATDGLSFLLAYSCYDAVSRKESLQRYQTLTNQSRSTARTVLRWFYELEDGCIDTASRGRIFDARILDYRVDVQSVLDTFALQEVNAVILVHRDGLSHSHACSLSGVQTDRPDKTIERIETKLGQAFDRKRLGDFLSYVDHLR